MLIRAYLWNIGSYLSRNNLCWAKWTIQSTLEFGSNSRKTKTWATKNTIFIATKHQNVQIQRQPAQINFYQRLNHTISFNTLTTRYPIKPPESSLLWKRSNSCLKLKLTKTRWDLRFIQSHFCHCLSSRFTRSNTACAQSPNTFKSRNSIKISLWQKMSKLKMQKHQRDMPTMQPSFKQVTT